MTFKRFLGGIIVLSGISGCATYEFNPEQADITGKHDGMLEIAFSGDLQRLQLGQLLMSCYERDEQGVLQVVSGRIYFEGENEPVGIVTADGKIQVHSYNGSVFSFDDINKDTYFVIDDTLDDNNQVKGVVVFTLGNSTSGCRYNMTGRLIQEELLAVK